jgi:reactive intermediate/imine deaminase
MQWRWVNWSNMKIFFKFLAVSFLLTVTTLANAEQLTDSPYYRAGDFVYIAGQVAIDPATGKIVSADETAQVNQIFKNLQAITNEAGGSLQNIVKLNVYMKNIDKTFPIVKGIIPKYFKPPYPARTPIGDVKIGKDMLLEVDAIMYLPVTKK